MSDESISVLEELLDDCLQNKKDLENELQNHLNRLEEINIFLQSVEQSEETDLKIFSPRSIQNIHFDKIKEVKEEKKTIEKENQFQNDKIEKINHQIENIKLLLKNSNDRRLFFEEGSIKNFNSQDGLRHLKILDVQEKERIRIARELHDSSLQNLTHLIHVLELSSMFIEQDPIRAKLELASCSQSLKQTISEIRDTIFNLRPMSFDDLGFKQCIENYIDNMRQQFKNCLIQYEVDDIKVDLLDSQLKEKYNLFLVTAYRIIQEAIINSLKHSGADNLKLYIKEKENRYLVQIIDNGKGFSMEEIAENSDKHFGISIMRERVFLLNGTIKIDTGIGEGTNIEIEFPKP